jgi:hypothetical protein
LNNRTPFDDSARSAISPGQDEDQQAMDEFACVNAGVTSPAEFFAEENVELTFATAQ